MDYTLQTGDAPKPVRIKPPRQKYPFREMEVGQFFFVPGGKSHTMMSLASATGKRLGRRLVTRQLYMRKLRGGWAQCGRDDPGATLGVAVYREE